MTDRAQGMRPVFLAYVSDNAVPVVLFDGAESESFGDYTLAWVSERPLHRASARLQILESKVRASPISRENWVPYAGRWRRE